MNTVIYFKHECEEGEKEEVKFFLCFSNKIAFFLQ